MAKNVGGVIRAFACQGERVTLCSKSLLLHVGRGRPFDVLLCGGGGLSVGPWDAVAVKPEVRHSVLVGEGKLGGGPLCIVVPVSGSGTLPLLTLSCCPPLLRLLDREGTASSSSQAVGFMQKEPCDIGSALACIEDECHSRDSGAEVAAFCALTGLLVQFGRHYVATSAWGDERLLADVLGYLERNCATTTLGDTAKHFGRHPNTIASLLKKGTGKTYCELVRSCRLELAAQLLLCGCAPIEDVARRCGYMNVGNFYQAFKRYWGSTPGEFSGRARGDA